MLDIVIILVRKLSFAKLPSNLFLKNIFEITLRCTVSTVGEIHEIILSITVWDLEPHAACKTKLLMSIVHNFQPS